LQQVVVAAETVGIVRHEPEPMVARAVVVLVKTVVMALVA
jgi:hypothetical protein